MKRHSPFAVLLREDLSPRQVPNPHRLWRRKGWFGLLGSAITWFALVTWLGHDIHFDLDAYWLAALAIPFIALGTAHYHVNEERKYGTLGWWLALPRPAIN